MCRKKTGKRLPRLGDQAKQAETALETGVCTGGRCTAVMREQNKHTRTGKTNTRVHYEGEEERGGGGGGRTHTTS